MKKVPEVSHRSGLGLLSPHVGVGILCAGLIAIGWIFSEELDLSPADGLGYALGIVGLAAMTLLLGYSLRKRIKFLRGAGPMRTWFEIHLVLGLVGPTAILYHSGFELGSTNSTISLGCVLAVSGSGLGGRYLYGHMHRSLAGPRRTVASYFSQAAKILAPANEILERVPTAKQDLDRFSDYAQSRISLFFLPAIAIAIRPRAWATRRRVLGKIRSSARPHVISEPLKDTISQHFDALCRGVELQFFEKLFSLWHAIHVPLTFILFISAGVHVLAVHLY